MKHTFHDPANRQINFLDSRYYTKNGTDFYPSVTTVLEDYPKGWALEQWKKDLGPNADIILERAGKEGSAIHDAIDNYLKGGEVRWMDEKTGEAYTLTEWQCILRFVDFMETFKPEVITTETILIIEDLRLGGTIDLVCELNGERWLIDYKSSNGIYDTYELQVSAYAKMWNTKYPDLPIQRRGILHLKAQTRGADRKGLKMQGAGWQVKEIDRSVDVHWEIFEHLRAIWDECNPKYKPGNLVLPDRIKLNTTQTILA